MNIVEYLITNIGPLPWIVKGTGFALMAYLVFRSIGQFFSLRWVRAATSLVSVLVIALIMARFGQDIAAFLATEPAVTTSGSTQG